MLPTTERDLDQAAALVAARFVTGRHDVPVNTLGYVEAPLDRRPAFILLKVLLTAAASGGQEAYNGLLGKIRLARLFRKEQLHRVQQVLIVHGPRLLSEIEAEISRLHAEAQTEWKGRGFG